MRIGFENAVGLSSYPPDISANHQLVSSNVISAGASTVVFTPATGTVVTNGSATYFGLPVIGFSVNSYTNGAIAVNGVNTLSAYGGNFIHKGSRSIKSP